MTALYDILITQNILGLIPTNKYFVIFPLATILLWLLFYPFAWKRNIRIFYNSSLRASWWEEILFRGFVMGAALYYFKNDLYALLASSFLFGIFHMRNMWWAGLYQSIQSTLYNMFVTGILFGLIRLMSGDIYIGIFAHFMHNFFILITAEQTERWRQRIPTDTRLKEINSR